MFLKILQDAGVPLAITFIIALLVFAAKTDVQSGIVVVASVVMASVVLGAFLGGNKALKQTKKKEKDDKSDSDE